MCNDFSCVCQKKGPVLWKLGVSNHRPLIEAAGLKDDTADPRYLTFARVEIVPNNRDYRHPDEWRLDIDEAIMPAWWSAGYAAMCWDAHRQWCKQLYAILDTETEIQNPFYIRPPQRITKHHIQLLERWISVGDSVRYSVRYAVQAVVGASVEVSVGDSVEVSVGTSVRKSLRDSIWASVGQSTGGWVAVGTSIGRSVWHSMWAQIGRLFRLSREAWHRTDHISGDDYPFQSAVDLWNLGLVPVYNGKYWCLYGSPNGDGNCVALWRKP